MPDVPHDARPVRLGGRGSGSSASFSRRIDECATAAEIKNELVGEFGAGFSRRRRSKGFDLLAWWLPIGGIILGAVAVAFGVWRWSRARVPARRGAAGSIPRLERQLDELLARQD